MFAAGLSGVLAGGAGRRLRFDIGFVGSTVYLFHHGRFNGETWVTATFLQEVTADLELASSEPDFITASRLDNTLITVREWFQVGSAPTRSDCAGLFPDLRSWQLQFRNL